MNFDFGGVTWSELNQMFEVVRKKRSVKGGFLYNFFEMEEENKSCNIYSYRQ